MLKTLGVRSYVLKSVLKCQTMNATVRCNSSRCNIRCTSKPNQCMMSKYNYLVMLEWMLHQVFMYSLCYVLCVGRLDFVRFILSERGI